MSMKEELDARSTHGGPVGSGLDIMIAAVKVAVVKIKGDAIRFDRLSPETTLWDADDGVYSVALDSLDMLDLVLMLEDEYGANILDSFDPANIRTIGDLASSLVSTN